MMLTMMMIMMMIVVVVVVVVMVVMSMNEKFKTKRIQSMDDPGWYKTYVWGEFIHTNTTQKNGQGWLKLSVLQALICHIKYHISS